MNYIRKISLKVKFLLIIVGLSGTMLMTYAYLALNDFEKDKLAYVFDSSKNFTNSTSNQLKSLLDLYIEKINFYVRGYDLSTKKIHPYSKSVFKSEKYLNSIYVFSLAPNGDLSLGDQLTTENSAISPDEIVSDFAFSGQQKTHIFYPEGSNSWVFGLRIKISAKKELFVYLEINSLTAIKSFIEPQMQDTYLVNSKGKIILQPIQKTYPDISFHDTKNSLLESIKASHGASVATYEYNSPTSGVSLLTSVSKTGVEDYYSFSILPKDIALEAVKLLIVKSAMFLLLLLFITIIISVLASTRLTSTLKKLLLATNKISQGDYNVSVNINSQDEIGNLANGFNKMASEIERLMIETAEKARMEGELKTAQTVQSTLFPNPQFSKGPVHIHGFYESASECGGDWWYYNQIGSKTFLWIGDATGHGVPAALVTSAARSAASILEEFPSLMPSQIMNLLNKAIYSASKGNVLMTFFLGVFSEDSKQFNYCCASHDPPFLLKSTGEKLKKKDLLLLMDVNGPRLGEEEKSTYEEACIQLEDGDQIVFYTDGVTELMNSDEKMWGERKFIANILKSYNENQSLAESITNLGQEIDSFKDGYPLQDDVTYVMFKYDQNI